MILNPSFLTLDLFSLQTATQPVSKQGCVHSALADQSQSIPSRGIKDAVPTAFMQILLTCHTIFMIGMYVHVS
jgi:hypothetical protein